MINTAYRNMLKLKYVTRINRTTVKTDSLSDTKQGFSTYQFVIKKFTVYSFQESFFSMPQYLKYRDNKLKDQR